MAQKIVIIGGGVLGLSIACKLAEADQTVVVLDSGAEGASIGSLAWLNVCSTRDMPYAALRSASLRLWRRMAETPGCPARITGSLLWGRHGEIDSGLEVMAANGWAARAVTAEEFAALAPGVGAPPERALYAPEEGVVDPAEVLAWLKGRAEAAGVEIHRGAEAAGLIARGDRVTGVALAGDGELAADHVAIAAGRGTPALLASLGYEFPLRHAPGALARTNPVPPLSGPMLASPEMDMWQAPDGRLMLATAADDMLNAPPEQAGDQALERLRRLCPDIGAVSLEQLTLRNRPIPEDGLPMIGPIPGLAGATVAVTHSGMTLAPVIAEIVAAAALGHPAPIDATRYQLDRPLAEAAE